jgi:hypothetical protein
MCDNLDVKGREVWPGRPELKYRECGHVRQHVTGYNVTITIITGTVF